MHLVTITDTLSKIPLEKFITWTVKGWLQRGLYMVFKVTQSPGINSLSKSEISLAFSTIFACGRSLSNSWILLVSTFFKHYIRNEEDLTPIVEVSSLFIFSTDSPNNPEHSQSNLSSNCALNTHLIIFIYNRKCSLKPTAHVVFCTISKKTTMYRDNMLT